MDDYDVQLDSDCYVEVTIHCDRCNQDVIGHFGGEFTSGYYLCIAWPWLKYADDGERRLCEHCMQTDYRYLADYGVITPSA